MTYRGNSLLEYALPLVVLFMAGTLLVVLGDVPRRFGSLFAATMNANPAGGGTLQVKPLGSDVPGDVTDAPMASVPAGLPGQDLGNDLQGLHSSILQAVETAGGNGATTMLANRLEVLADQLVASGEISEGEGRLLKALANKGHRIALFQRYLEEEVAKAGSTRDLWVEKHQFDGNSNMSLLQISQELSSTTEANSIEEWIAASANDYHISGPQREFVDMYQSAESQGALNHPKVRELVSQLGNEIVVLSEASGDVVNSIAMGDVPPADMQDSLYSRLNDRYSANICGTGGNTDTGTQCQ